MDMVKVNEIKETYSLKAEEENYENDKTIDILITSKEAIKYNELVGTEADTLAFGEFTRRFEKSMKELEILMGI